MKNFWDQLNGIKYLYMPELINYHKLKIPFRKDSKHDFVEKKS